MLALDLGGTRLKAAAVHDGQVGPLVVVPHGGTWAAAQDAVRAVVASLAGDGCAAVGLGVPGVVVEGRVVALPGKLDGLVGVDLRAWLSSFAPRLVVVNDASAYGVGEAVRGAGRGHDRVVVVTLGTGVGVCVVEHGRPLGDGPLGGGQLGGALPLGDRTLEERCRASALGADPEAVVAAARGGDPAAVAAVEEVRSWLVQGLAVLACAHSPSALVVGGGPLSTDGLLLDGVEERVRQHLWPQHRCVVLRAELGDGAALAGLAELAR
jgi:glucokinase